MYEGCCTHLIRLVSLYEGRTAPRITRASVYEGVHCIMRVAVMHLASTSNSCHVCDSSWMVSEAPCTCHTWMYHVYILPCLRISSTYRTFCHACDSYAAMNSSYEISWSPLVSAAAIISWISQGAMRMPMESRASRSSEASMLPEPSLSRIAHVSRATYT